jgi:hypothetical protein
MLFKTFSIVAVAVLVANVSSANEFNAKELNGRTSYVGVAYLDTQTGDNQFDQSAADDTTNVRDGKKLKFKDSDGFLATIGNDYGYVRIETELGYRDTSVTSVTSANPLIKDGSGEVNIGTAMMNLAVEYSIDLGDAGGDATKELSGISITPYIMAGGGAMGVHGDLNYIGSNATRAVEATTHEGVDNGMLIAPAIQGGVGLTIGLPAGVELFGGYSEILAYTYKYRGSNDIHIKTVSGGLRINF